MPDVPVIIIGGGPAGLACAAALKIRGHTPIVLDQNNEIGASWASRYERLRLHTVRAYSGLPYHPIPREYPRYVPRDLFVEYLQDYAERFELDIVRNCRVQRVLPGENNAGFQVMANTGNWQSQAVIVATGHFGVPVIPDWPGSEEFSGELIHSVEFSRGSEFAEQRVLIVGAGNTGAELAADIAQNGAKYTAISVRTPPPVVPRDFLGMPVQVFGILLSLVPARLADRIGHGIAKVALGDLTQFGLEAPAWQPFTAKRIPIIDVGFVEQLKMGRVHIRPNVGRLRHAGVVFENGSAEAFDVIIAATGFRTGLDQILDLEGVLRPDGFPKLQSGMLTPVPGLYFVGFYETHRGHLFEANRGAKQLAKIITSRMNGS